MYVLIVEDNSLVGEGIETGLIALGFRCEWVQSAGAAKAALNNVQFDAMILDLGLPDQDGLQFLEQQRQLGQHIPILILTARDAVPERVRGLQKGADDYLTKPFDLEELAARLHSIQRRANGQMQDTLICGDLKFNAVLQQVYLAEQPIILSKSEMVVLSALMQPPGRVCSTNQLQDRLYGWADGVDSNAVAVHIHNLRRKLGEHRIQTLRGQGYRIIEPTEDE